MRLRAALSVSRIFTAKMTASAAETSPASAATLTGLRCSLPISLFRRRPELRIASRCAPRARKVTSLPAAARRAPKYPPTPPDPITVIFKGCALMA